MRPSANWVGALLPAAEFEGGGVLTCAIIRVRDTRHAKDSSSDHGTSISNTVLMRTLRGNPANTVCSVCRPTLVFICRLGTSCILFRGKSGHTAASLVQMVEAQAAEVFNLPFQDIVKASWMGFD